MMVNTLGSMILAIVQLVISQMSVMLLGCFTFNHHVRKLYNFFRIDGPLRPLIILFYLEGYLDLLIGALINTENDYLFLVSSNWGPNGNLTFSDQFTVILGNFFHFTCIIFPVVVLYILRIKVSDHALMLQKDREGFNELYECLYEDFREQKSGLLHYYAIYMIRRVIFVIVCFWLWTPEYTMVQVHVNILLGLFFTLYLLAYHPFRDKTMNRLQIVNEYCFVMISIH